MTHLSLVSIVLGALIIVTRTPLLFAPRATLEVYGSLYRTDTRARLVGLLAASVGLCMILAASTSSGVGASVFWVWGWLAVLVAGLVPILFPAAYRGLVGAALGWAAASGRARALGALAVALGVLLVYLGMYVL
jgi:hypothetical protein